MRRAKLGVFLEYFAIVIDNGGKGNQHKNSLPTMPPALKHPSLKSESGLPAV
jgi:hypothetical protein